MYLLDRKVFYFKTMDGYVIGIIKCYDFKGFL